jgi:hypothetical protein
LSKLDDGGGIKMQLGLVQNEDHSVESRPMNVECNRHLKQVHLTRGQFCFGNRPAKQLGLQIAVHRGDLSENCLDQTQ